MSKGLYSVGVDVGTTSTQLVLSRLQIENRAGAFAVPEMEIVRREILYRGKVHFTPLLNESLADGQGIRRIVEAEYRAAGIRREDVDTGAIIITGETSRKENARAVLDALSDLAGDFVVASAGPDLESVLAAKGAGADAFSADTGETVLHMDIGGGTSNLALIREGRIVKTGCLNVGGRLVKFDAAGTLEYISPVLEGLCDWKVGQRITRPQARELAQLLTRALEMAAGLREAAPLLDRLRTREAGEDWTGKEVQKAVLSFSGGVADCIRRQLPWLEYGDLGPLLGEAIRESTLCRGAYRLGEETIRATVIGAGCHSAQLSGSTVFCRNMALPLKNVPVVALPEPDREEILRQFPREEELAVLAFPGQRAPSYSRIRAMAEQIAAAGVEPVLVCTEQDMAMALGQALAVRMGPEAKILCIDRVRLGENCYLDVGRAVGPAFPVVVKTLVLGREPAEKWELEQSVRRGI